MAEHCTHCAELADHYRQALKVICESAGRAIPYHDGFLVISDYAAKVLGERREDAKQEPAD